MPENVYFGDVVGLLHLHTRYANDASTCCVHHANSQIDALDRTQPALPMRAGYAETRTRLRPTLFAALNVLEGTVIGSCKPRHRGVPGT